MSNPVPSVSIGAFEVQAEIVSDEHWYLNELAVDPPFQGKGYGSSLMRYMLKRITKNWRARDYEDRLLGNI